MARDECALSAGTTNGLVLGLPSRRGIRRAAITWSKAGEMSLRLPAPPRDRPTAWSAGSSAGALLAGPGAVLAHVHSRRVDRDDPVQVAVGIGLGEQRVKTLSQVPSTAQV